MNASLVVRDGRPDDAPRLAKVHAAAFPDYFQTHMGEGFLRRFYGAFLQPGHLVVVGEVDGTVVGLVAGTSDLERFRRDLYPPNIVPFAATFAVKLVTDPVVRRSAWRRLGHVRIAVRSLLDRWRRRPSDVVPPQPDATMYLFSIAVDPASHGRGIAAPLMEEFTRRSAAAGSTRIELTVLTVNDRAIRFYEREGWVRVSEEGESYAYAIEL